MIDVIYHGFSVCRFLPRIKVVIHVQLESYFAYFKWWHRAKMETITGSLSPRQTQALNTINLQQHRFQDPAISSSLTFLAFSFSLDLKRL